ncbi:hypothetical protein JCM6882_005834 [Rhodosporidiobolus microsporus]
MSASTAPASAAPTAVRDEPALFRLPTELLLDVLSQLSYEELHKVEQVSRRLRTLAKDQQLDRNLFRAKFTSEDFASSTSVKLHPLMEAVYAVHVDAEDAPILVYNGEIDTYNAYGYSACDEFVTKPTCKALLVDLGVGPPFFLRNSEGVKNRQAFRAIGKFWAEKLPWDIAEELAEPGQSLESVRWHDALGDRCGWTGWRQPSNMGDGTVGITAGRYDS